MGRNDFKGLLCKIGIHKWEDVTPLDTPMDVEDRKCKNCERKQRIIYIDDISGRNHLDCHSDYNVKF
jgi:hypothetical protein